MTEITILTINTQKMGTNSPSLTDMITLLDQHTPGVLLLTETPPIPHQGALNQVLRNRGYKTHYHTVHTPSPKDKLPEARLPTHTTHNGGGCWIAYNKQAPWATTVRNLTLPGSCPKATTCAIEFTMHSGAKATIVACYLPQNEEAHSQTCKTLARLTTTLPHHTIIIGGDFQGN